MGQAPLRMGQCRAVHRPERLKRSLYGLGPHPHPKEAPGSGFPYTYTTPIAPYVSPKAYKYTGMKVKCR